MTKYDNIREALKYTRPDSEAGFVEPLHVPNDGFFQVPKDRRVIVRKYVFVEGLLYVEGTLVVI